MKETGFDKTIMKNVGKVILLVCLLLLSSTLAQSDSDYNLSWSTIDGGGGTSSGGPYQLVGTIDQPDAAWSSGGDFELLGGFWLEFGLTGFIIDY